MVWILQKCQELWFQCHIYVMGVGCQLLWIQMRLQLLFMVGFNVGMISDLCVKLWSEEERDMATTWAF